MAQNKDVKEPQQPLDPAAQFTAAAERIWTNAKWLLAVFAAVAGVLTAGIQLSSLGKLDFGSRLAYAIAAGALALAFVGAIIASVITIITPRYMTLSTLVKLSGSQTWLGRERHEIAFVREAGLLGMRYTSLADLETAYKEAESKKDIDEIYAHIRTVLAAVLYEQVRYAFRRSSIVMLVCATGAAACIGVFAWAANPRENPSKLETPSEALVTLSQAGQQELAPIVGRECVKSPIPVVVLFDDGQSADVVTEPDGHCKLARFTIGKAPSAVEGTLVPSHQVRVGQ